MVVSRFANSMFQNLRVSTTSISGPLCRFLVDKNHCQRHDDDSERVKVEVDAVVEPLDQHVNHVEQAVARHLVAFSHRVRENLLAAVPHLQLANGRLNRQLIQRAEVDLRDLDDTGEAKIRSDQILRLLALRALHDIDELSGYHRRELDKAEHKGNTRVRESFRMSQTVSHHIDAAASTRNAGEVQQQSREEQAQLESGLVVKHHRHLGVGDKSMNEEDLEGQHKQCFPEEVELVIL